MKKNRKLQQERGINCEEQVRSLLLSVGRSIAPETDSSDFFFFDIRLASMNTRKSQSPLNNRKNSHKNDDVFNIFQLCLRAPKILMISFARSTF